MIKSLSTVSVWVHDQDEALAFYTDKLGFQVREDVSLAELGDFRWLTVGPAGQDDIALALMSIPGAPVFDAETEEQVKSLMAKGAAGALFLATDDCRGTYDELRGRGVQFTEEPSERPYGIDAALNDPSGNSIRLVERPSA
jgi:catechol 2,3-dioxygenase-like lactoylglutathione lyase family enzyme